MRRFVLSVTETYNVQYIVDAEDEDAAVQKYANGQVTDPSGGLTATGDFEIRDVTDVTP